MSIHDDATIIANLRETVRLQAAELDELRKQKRQFPLQTSKHAPPGPRSIPWEVAEIAYGAYSKLYGSSQSLERLAERGGFGWCEMDSLYPKWREDVSTINRLESELAELRQLVAAFGTDAYRLNHAAVVNCVEHNAKQKGTT